jgi:hypothetical protein
MAGLTPPDSLPPDQQELWKKADQKRRRQSSTPLVIKNESVETVTSGNGGPKSPIVAEQVPVTTTTVVRPK